MMPLPPLSAMIVVAAWKGVLSGCIAVQMVKSFLVGAVGDAEVLIAVEAIEG